MFGLYGCSLIYLKMCYILKQGDDMKRNNTVDLIKGLGIFCVVLAHSGFPLSDAVYLFHMPIFLMASGYCFRQKHAESPSALGAYIGKKVKSLYVPYVIFNAIFILFYNALISWNIYTDNAQFSSPVQRKTWWQLWSALNNCLHFNPGGTQQLCGADWFVIILFYITVLFAVACWFTRIFKNKTVQNVLLGGSAVAALFVGCLLQKKRIFLDGYWSPAVTGYALYVLGFFLSKLPASSLERVMAKLKWPFAVLGAAFFLVATRYGSISLNVNHFTDPLFLVVCSLVGWFWLYALADIMKASNLLNRIFSCLSKSSLFILFLHFLGFKLVTAIQLAVYNEPGYLLASFPVLHTEGLWWIAYTAVGLLFPVAVKLLFNFTASLIKRKVAAMDKAAAITEK